MAMNTKTYNPVQSITMTAASDIPAFRFVNYSGGLCSNNTLAAGVSEVSWAQGSKIQVVTLGTRAVECAGVINTGDDVASANDGKARVALPGEKINGRALEGAGIGGFAKIKLVP